LLSAPQAPLKQNLQAMLKSHARIEASGRIALSGRIKANTLPI
jgi:hypothetical protein